MLNEAIINLYVDHGTLTPDFTMDTTPEQILTNLSLTGIKYTWETVKEEKLNNTQSVIEVRVYLPGHIVYGRHVYDTVTEASNAHLYAISNAICIITAKNSFINPNVIVTPDFGNNNETAIKQQPIPNPQQQVQPLSQEDILNMIVQEQKAPEKITTAEQFANDSRELVPFDEVDLNTEELDKLIEGKTYTAPQQPVSHGFTQAQITAINDFKRKMNITDDAMLSNYINSWDNKYSRKEDLTPANIDSFIEWTNNVGKAPC